MNLLIYNTLYQKKQYFTPIQKGKAGIYSCGPTVYRSAHLGNLRSYLMADWLRRILEYGGYEVTHVKNITDVGHMRREILDRGEDKVVAAARAAGKTSKEIADFYLAEFLNDEIKLNIKPAHIMPKATDHIAECIELIAELLAQGCAYQVNGAVYFDVSRFPNYGKLSGNQINQLQQGVRVEVDNQKKRQEDFALWKAAEKGREMKWNSPWGEGFPGWHVECSAMSMKYLGKTFDFHTGGVDNIFPHHEDEIAQSEAVVGQEAVRYWAHGQHLLADGLKMSKSTGNSYTIADIENIGFDPLAFRYLALTAHYRKRLNFTFNSLKAAQRGLTRLRDRALRLAQESEGIARCYNVAVHGWKEAFTHCISNDMALPSALEITNKMLDSNLKPSAKLACLFDFDHVLGLNLQQFVQSRQDIPEPVDSQIKKRQILRSEGAYSDADEIRKSLGQKGYWLQDSPEGVRIRHQAPIELKGGPILYSSSKEIPSNLNLPDFKQVSFVIVSRNNFDELVRLIESIDKHCAAFDYEIIVVDNGSTDSAFMLVDELNKRFSRLTVIHADHNVGQGCAVNMGLKRAQGSYIALADCSIELKGDVLTATLNALKNKQVGAVGHKGMRTDNFKEFFDDDGPEVDAAQLYFLAFPRAILEKTGLMNEKFRFYRHIDLYFAFAVKATGLRVKAIPSLPIKYHDHREWLSLDEEDRNKKSRYNFGLFYKKWHHSVELLTNRQKTS
jgi:cysteinyl-tRNA synthetase